MQFSENRPFSTTLNITGNYTLYIKSCSSHNLRCYNTYSKQKTGLDFSHLVLLIDLVHASHIIHSLHCSLLLKVFLLFLLTSFCILCCHIWIRVSWDQKVSERSTGYVVFVLPFLEGWQVYVATLLTLACIHCTDYRLQCTPICHTTTDTVTHNTLPLPTSVSWLLTAPFWKSCQLPDLYCTFLYGWTLNDDGFWAQYL